MKDNNINNTFRFKCGKILYMNRHETRKKLVFAVYQYLLLNSDLNSTVVDAFDVEDITLIDEYVLKLVGAIKANRSSYIEEISKHLKRWTFERLNYLDQAILLVGAAELDIKTVDKAIVINEAINLAKEYCDDDAFKYINGVLDQL